MNEIELLRKEIDRLKRRVDELEAREKTRDIEFRDGLLLIIRGIEKRQGLGRYSENARAREPLHLEV